MTPTKLTHFIMLAEHANFQSAARALGISQPALTKSIAKLETELGVKLLNRARGRTSELTLYGQELYGRGAKLLEDIGEMRDSIELMKKGHAGRIRIGFGTTVGPSRAAEISTRLQTQLSDCMISLRVGSSHHLLPRLRRGELDLLIGSATGQARLDDMHIVKLWSDPFAVFVGAHHELAIHDTYDPAWATHYEWLSSDRLARADMRANRFLGHTRETVTPSKFDIFDPHIMARLLATSQYLSAWPTSTFADSVARGEHMGLIIPPVDGERWMSDANLIYKRGLETSAVVQAAGRHIQRMDF